MRNGSKLKKAQERRSLQTYERRRKILSMFRDGANGVEIAKAMGLSRQRCNELLNEELRLLGQERRALANEVFDLELERLGNIVRNCTVIMSAPCRECVGTGHGSEPFEGTEGLADACGRCYGTGKMYPPDVRLRGMRELRMAIDQRSKMLGLYAPEKFAFTDAKGNDLDFTEELQALTGEELSQAVDDFQAGMEAARQAESG